jgi:hypothetical protein
VQILINFSAFYGTRRFLTVFTRSLHWSLSWAWWIQSTPPHSISLTFILILSTHLRVFLPSGLFPSGFPSKILYAFFPHSCYMPCEFFSTEYIIQALGCSKQNNLRIPWSKIFPKKLTVAWLKKFCGFSEILMSITLYTRVIHWTLCRATGIQSTTSHFIYPRSSNLSLSSKQALPFILSELYFVLSQTKCECWLLHYI